MKKNTAALVFAIVGSIFGVAGTIKWALCASACASVVGGYSIYTLGFLLLGVGGAVLSLIGGIQAYSFKGGRVVLSLLGALFQAGNLILQVLFVDAFSIVGSLWTLLAIVMTVLATIFSGRQPE